MLKPGSFGKKKNNLDSLIGIALAHLGQDLQAFVAMKMEMKRKKRKYLDTDWIFTFILCPNSRPRSVVSYEDLAFVVIYDGNWTAKASWGDTSDCE